MFLSKPLLGFRDLLIINKKLFEGLKQAQGLKLDASPSSNMGYFNLADEMKKRGVLVDWAGPRRFRLATHYWVDDAGVEKTVKAFGELLK